MPLLNQDNPESLAKRTADRVKFDIRRAFNQMKNTYTTVLNTVWNHPQLTPQEIFDEFASEGAELFFISDAMITLMQNIAGIDVGDVIPEKYEYQITPEGNVYVWEKSSSSSSQQQSPFSSSSAATSSSSSSQETSSSSSSSETNTSSSSSGA